MTNERPAKAVKPPPTTSDRLREVVAKLCPVTMARYKATGHWGEPDDTDDVDAAPVFHPRISAPYSIKHVKAGRLVQVTSEDGDVIGGLGATTAEAVTRLRVKVGLEQEKIDA